MDQLAIFKDVSIVVAGAVALVTFALGVFQIARQGHDHRASQFVQMRRRFLEDPTFREILSLLATGDPRVADISIQDRRNLVGFFEEVGLMVNSKLIHPDVAHYMFGYYVLLVDQSPHFWTGLDKPSEYWDVFRGFAEAMRSRRGGRHARRKLRL